MLLFGRRSSPVRPRLEALEDRITRTTFNVTPGGTGLGSLAGAINQANMDQQADTIVLAPGTYSLSAVGQQTIDSKMAIHPLGELLHPSPSPTHGPKTYFFAKAGKMRKRHAEKTKSSGKSRIMQLGRSILA
jgi:hypothetical protein